MVGAGAPRGVEGTGMNARTGVLVLIAGLGSLGCSATAPSPDDVGLGIVSAGSAEGTESSDAKTDDPVAETTDETSVGGTGLGDTSGGAFDDDTGEPRFDLGTQPDLGPQVPDACTKVDVLFVIDNSQSMAGEQANLVAAFPGFASGMQTALESAESYHVGVVTSDSYSGNGGTCQGVGHLVNRPSCGAHASGYRWFDETEPDLASMFACEASVGTGGDNDERQMDAAMRAIGPIYATPGDCNEFFIREDALLVIVFITDEPDRDSSGSPQDWFDAIVEAKGGIEENIVVLPTVPKSGCADAASDIEAFTQLFTNHAIGDICAGGYDTFFTDAIDEIDTACDMFVPPG